MDYDYSCRFNGGHLSEPSNPYVNLLDILENGDKIHLLPTGIQFATSTKTVLGNGVAIDAETLLSDLKKVDNYGANLKDRLFISSR